ncbi:TRAP-type C4-dicarboxylate transport system, small permease component [Anaerovirgula multivorans]|uniref:TRAP-type C4-dicarboxylate transport system, small permease component n=1 Tax=Anaerovirgula multivorans TaxID=312168 RepID=A0A239JJL6_9FIRM|nr:TRAP transporter small permease [Anaerovirgula multivorans]SNT06081.1 TRAP-type C4-dicarboxylate transport system, small permease component [Anaerovirgula multivorans]
MKIKSLITKVLDILTVITFIALISVVVLQVLGRTPLLPKAFHWTEEVTRMLFLFLISVASISAVLHNEFVSVDLFTSRLQGKVLLIYNTIIHFVLGIFLLYLIPAGIKFMNLGARQLSPGLRVNMKYVHSLILLSLAGMALAHIYMGTNNLISLKNRNKERRFNND